MAAELFFYYEKIFKKKKNVSFTEYELRTLQGWRV